MSYKRNRNSSKRPTPKQIRFANLYVSEYLPGKATLKQITEKAGYKSMEAGAILKSECVQDLIGKGIQERKTGGIFSNEWSLSKLMDIYETARFYVITPYIDKNGEEQNKFNAEAASTALKAIKRICKLLGYDKPQRETTFSFDLFGNEGKKDESGKNQSEENDKPE